MIWILSWLRIFLQRTWKNEFFPDINNEIFSKDKGMAAIDESGLITVGTMLNAEYRCPMNFDKEVEVNNILTNWKPKLHQPRPYDSQTKSTRVRMRMNELDTCWHHLGGLQCRSSCLGSFWIPWWSWFFFWKKQKFSYNEFNWKNRAGHLWGIKEYCDPAG